MDAPRTNMLTLALCGLLTTSTFLPGADDKPAPANVEQPGTPKLETVVADAAAYHPDGKRYALARHNEIALYDDTTGKKLLQFSGVHDNRIMEIVFSPDGETLATISYCSNLVKLWDVHTGTERKTFTHWDRPIHVAFVGDGKSIAAVSGVRLWQALLGHAQLKVWVVATGNEVLSLKIPNNYPPYAAFSGDGRRFACSSQDHADIQVWDLPSGKLAFTSLRTTDDKPPQELVALNADGRKLATFQPLTKSIGVYDVPGDHTSPNLRTDMTAGITDRLAFTPTGAVVLTGNTHEEDLTGKVSIKSRFNIFFPSDPKRLPLKGTGAANGIVFRPDGRKALLLDSTDRPDAGKIFKDASVAVVALAPGQRVLQGMVIGKPPPFTLSEDARGLDSAEFRFAQNTTNGGKPPRPPQNPTLPHFDVLVSLWRATPSAQPPGNVQVMRVNGVEYNLSIMVGGSDADLVRQVRGIFEKTFAPWMGPPGP